MDFSTFKTLTISGNRIKKLQTSSGLILFEETSEPGNILPSTASLTTYNASTMIPEIIYMVHRDSPFATPIQFSATIAERNPNWVRYYGYSGSYVIDHLIMLNNGNPYQIRYRDSNLYMPVEGHSVSISDANQQKSYMWMNKESSSQTQTINIRWGSASGPTTSTLTLDGLTYRNASGNAILTVNDTYVGYTSTIFGTDENYNFNEHHGEEFRLQTPGGYDTLSFVIG